MALPEALLPVTLPEMTDFRPPGAAVTAGRDPVPPLARAAGWAEVELDLGEGRRTYRRELNTMPQWAGSCWYYLRYLDPMNDTAFVDPRRRAVLDGPRPGATPGDGGVDLYVGGAEHAVLHLLYARFWHKVLFDLGHVSTTGSRSGGCSTRATSPLTRSPTAAGFTFRLMKSSSVPTGHWSGTASR